MSRSTVIALAGVMALGSTLAWADGGGTDLAGRSRNRCVRDADPCPLAVEWLKVPHTRGKTAPEASALLRAAGFAESRPTMRPSDGMKAKRVMASNPYAGMRVPAGSAVVLYVADNEPGRAIRNFRGDTLAEARSRLVGGLESRMSFKSCGVDLGTSFADARSELVVVDQWPPEGTPVDGSWTGGELRLAPRKDLWRDFVGLTQGEARARFPTLYALKGWTLEPVSPDRRDLAATDGARRILGATADRDTCQITLAFADPVVEPIPPEPVAEEKDPPKTPLSPGLPLTGGALGGLLLARLFWPRGGGDDAMPQVVAQVVATTRSRLRVRRDVPV